LLAVEIKTHEEQTQTPDAEARLQKAESMAKMAEEGRRRQRADGSRQEE
jgi:hypothetical protein